MVFAGLLQEKFQDLLSAYIMVSTVFLGNAAQFLIRKAFPDVLDGVYVDVFRMTTMVTLGDFAIHVYPVDMATLGIPLT